MRINLGILAAFGLIGMVQMPIVSHAAPPAAQSQKEQGKKSEKSKKKASKGAMNAAAEKKAASKDFVKDQKDVKAEKEKLLSTRK